jgi:hypothetical protein
MEKRRDVLKDLVIRQRQAEAEGRSSIILPYSGDKQERSFYQGPMGYAGSGTEDRMPGTSGYAWTQPTLLENILDRLKIQKFQPKLRNLTPTKRPVERYPGVI